MRNLAKLPIIAVFLSLPIACSVSATVDESAVCKSVSLTLPSTDLDAGVSLTCSPSLCTYTKNNVDFSGALSKLNDVANISVSVAQNELSSNTGFAWLNSVEILASGSNTNDPQYPETDVVNQTVPNEGNDGSDQLNLTTSMDADTLKNYLMQGPVNLTFKLGLKDSNLPSTLTYQLCLSAEAKYHKSL